jgi:nucleotide-binding universal stress UspA family protein
MVHPAIATEKEKRMKILVGYDGSNSAKDALALAKKHAAAFDAKVIVVSSLTGGSVTHAVEVEHATEDLESAKKIFDDDGIACETKLLVRGMTPGEDLVDYAKEKAIDEIIIGIKRRSKVGKLLFGSNAQYVIIKAPCPVVTVK